MTAPLRLTFHGFTPAIFVAMQKALAAQRMRRAPGEPPDFEALHRETARRLRAALDVANDGLHVRAAMQIDAIRRPRGS